MRYLSLLLPAALLLVSCTSFMSMETFQAEGGTVYRNLSYSDVDDDDLLDVYLPTSPKTEASKGANLYPVIVWIHGGGWRWGTKDNVPVLGLAKAGYGLVSINYRLDGHAKFPAQIDDCRAALQWVKDQGAHYGLDVNRLGLIGASAGGHLVALLGTTEERFPALPKIRAVCALYPPTDLITVVGEGRQDSWFGLVPLLLGGSVTAKKQLAWEASPVNYVTSNAPPFFLIHGQLDTLVPVQQSIELKDTLVKAGVPCKLTICPNQKHGFYPDAPLTANIITFFNKYLK